MSLNNLNLKNTYDSRIDDIYNDFFNKVLSNSYLCHRIGGVFTSKNFAACAAGMQDFIQNDGKMELVLSPIFSPEDADAIYNEVITQEDKIAETWIKQIDEIKDKFEEDHTKALAWLLKNKHLEIKVAILKDQSGRPIDAQHLPNVSALKTKIGVFHGKNNSEFVSFKGNIDFDDPTIGEVYNFDVFRSWDNSERLRVDQHYETFLKYWNNAICDDDDNKRIITVIDLPTAIRDNLIAKAPESKDLLNLKYRPQPRSYQKQAVESWLANNGTGVFEMATGTGKTITAMYALDKISEQCDSLLVVVVSPFNTIADQWQSQFMAAGFDHVSTLNNPNWKRNVRDVITLLNLEASSGVNAIITSYVTYATQDFIDLIQTCQVPIMLLADEVHHAGAPQRHRGLLPDYTYRLGLTATFDRYYDEFGTTTLSDYFGKTVFKYDLEHAIKTKILVGYYYYPYYVDLTIDEYDKYISATNRIVMLLDRRKDEDVEAELEMALIYRSRIIRDAENKIPQFREIIKNHPDLKHTLIYCSEKQMRDVQTILMQSAPPILSRKITADNPKNPIERMQILRDFANEDYHAIVAIGVLDEGVDIPEAKHCILLSSSGNPKQFIQRRGRVLRQFFGKYSDKSSKDHSTIHDILILPGLDERLTPATKSIEMSIIRSQFDRQYDMARLAINADECLPIVEEQRRKLHGASS